MDGKLTRNVKRLATKSEARTDTVGEVSLDTHCSFQVMTVVLALVPKSVMLGLSTGTTIFSLQRKITGDQACTTPRTVY